MSSPTNCAATPSVISSPASADGPTPWLLQDGHLHDPCGLAAALANLSARQVRALGLQTSGISGQVGNTSSASAILQSSLESRLRVQLSGSDLCAVTWKPWAAPWGSVISRPRAQVRTIDVIASSLWPTPTASLADKGVRSIAGAIKEAARKSGPDLAAQTAAALWATPRASPNENRTTKLTPSQIAGRHGAYLAVQAIGSSDTTEKPAGSLNPAFVCWLMGYPQEWVNCAPSEMPSTRGRRQRSSPPICKPEA